MRAQQAKIDSGEVPFGICQILVADLTAHSGVEAEIQAISSYHFGVPVYELRELPGRWPEEAFCDPLLDRSEEDVPFEPAARHYSVDFEVQGEGGGVDTIRGVEDGLLYWCARRSDAAWIARGIRRVAEIRCKHAFETMFLFDGHAGLCDP